MLLKGKIVKTTPGYAEIALDQQGEGCKSCNMCNKDNCQTILAANPKNYKTGQEVTIELASQLYYNALLLLIVIPVSVLIGSLLVFSKFFPETIALLLAAVFWLGSYSLSRRYNNQLQEKEIYRIIS